MRVLLAPFSLFYRLAVLVRNALYDSGFLSQQAVHRPVIAVGNLSTGGTGKTPVVAWLCQILQELEIQPGIILRGYGGEQKAVALVPPQIQKVSDFSRRFGDEATLYRRQFAQVPIGVGGDRVANSIHLLSGYDVDVLLADDVFQHRRLKRDLNIALLDTTQDFHAQHLLPWGYLREPLSNIQRADLVFLTKCNLSDGINLVSYRNWLKENFKGAVFELDFVNDQATSVAGEVASDFDSPVVLVSALGNPGAFEASVKRHFGLEVKKHFTYPDHHRFESTEVQSLLEFCRDNDIRDIMMSEKDFVKLPSMELEGVRVWVSNLKVEMTAPEQIEFLKQTLKRACRKA